MGISLGSNISAQRAARQLNSISERLGRVFEQLSSGSRINRASDDPAGLAIATSLRNQQRLATVGIRNAQDGISALSIADAALSSISSILTRMSELAAQAANGAYSVNQRSALALEFEALGLEIERISRTTHFNRVGLLDGGGILVQLGLTGDPNSQLFIGGVNGTLGGLGLGEGMLAFSINGATILEGQSAARSALDALSGALGNLGGIRGALGASEARLGIAIDNLTVQREQYAAAESRIMDVDMAEAVAEMMRLLILQQVAAAVMAQAAQQPALALKLLQ